MFLLSSTGDCDTCKTRIPDKEIVKCRHCHNKFHAICNTAEKSAKICTNSFFSLYLTSKSNFTWACDTCVTKEEESAAASLSDQVLKLTQAVQNLEKKVVTPNGNIVEVVKQQVSTEFEKLKVSLAKEREEENKKSADKFMEIVRFQVAEEMRMISEHSVSTLLSEEAISKITAANQQVNREESVWGNKAKVDNIRSSLMVKPDTAGDPIDNKKVKKIVVENGIPVNSVKVSSRGETFVNLPDQSSRDKLIPLLTAEVTTDETPFEVVTLKSKLPTISLIGVTENLSPEKIKNCLYKQNDHLKALIDAKSHLSVIFVKPPSGRQEFYQVAIRVSPEIRKAIQSYGNRVHIEDTYYKVDDRFYIKRCNRCQDFHHYAEKCDMSKPEVCGYCTLHHKSNDCPNREKPHSEHLCINCKVADLDYRGHPTFWWKCPAYKAQQERLKKIISYNYDSKSN